MSEDYRGETFGFYYTRLQAKKEQEEKQKLQHRAVDSATQVDSLETGNLSDQEVQTDVAGTSKAHEENVEPEPPHSIDRLRNALIGTLALGSLQQPSKRKLNFDPL